MQKRPSVWRNLFREVLRGLLVPAILTLVVILVTRPYIASSVAEHARRWLNLIFAILAGIAVASISISVIKITHYAQKHTCASASPRAPQESLARIAQELTGSRHWCPRSEVVEIGGLLACALVYSQTGNILDKMHEFVKLYCDEWEREVERVGLKSVTNNLTRSARMLHFSLRDCRGRLPAGLPFVLDELEEIKKGADGIVADFKHRLLAPLVNPKLEHKDRQKEAGDGAQELGKLARDIQKRVTTLLEDTKREITRRLADLEGLTPGEIPDAA